LDAFVEDRHNKAKIAKGPINGPDDINQLRRLAELTISTPRHNNRFDNIFHKVVTIRTSGRQRPEVEKKSWIILWTVLLLNGV